VPKPAPRLPYLVQIVNSRSTGREIRLNRESLFERVWSEPVEKLAAGWGLSGGGLAKACHRLKIPVPPRGFLGEGPASEAAPTASTRSSTRRGCRGRDSVVQLSPSDVWQVNGEIEYCLFQHTASTAAVNLRLVNRRLSVNRLTT
jgi:hypothetical protein